MSLKRRGSLAEQLEGNCLFTLYLDHEDDNASVVSDLSSLGGVFERRMSLYFEEVVEGQLIEEDVVEVVVPSDDDECDDLDGSSCASEVSSIYDVPEPELPQHETVETTQVCQEELKQTRGCRAKDDECAEERDGSGKREAQAGLEEESEHDSINSIEEAAGVHRGDERECLQESFYTEYTAEDEEVAYCSGPESAHQRVPKTQETSLRPRRLSLLGKLPEDDYSVYTEEEVTHCSDGESRRQQRLAEETSFRLLPRRLSLLGKMTDEDTIYSEEEVTYCSGMECGSQWMVEENSFHRPRRLLLLGKMQGKCHVASEERLDKENSLRTSHLPCLGKLPDEYSVFSEEETVQTELETAQASYEYLSSSAVF